MVQLPPALHHDNNTMNARTKRLRELMAAHKLDAAAVGVILGRTAQTVRVWRSKYDARTIPADALKVLELTLAQRGQAA
jgi:D-alanyl-D-alanine carboxypeptidase